MPRRSRFHFITTTCRRCGQPVTTGSRSLFGLDDLKAQYDRVCESCTTLKERNALLRAMGERLARGGR